LDHDDDPDFDDLAVVVVVAAAADHGRPLSGHIWAMINNRVMIKGWEASSKLDLT
jgi:hypothetical protein